MIKHARLRGGVLVTVLFVCVIVTAITGALIFTSYYRNLAVLKTEIKERLILNAFSGINYLMASPLPNSEAPQLFDLYNQETDSVQVSSKPWGLWDILISKAWLKRHEEIKIAMTGPKPDVYGNAALYLVNNNRDLSVAGVNSIVGNAYVPNAIVKIATIHGTGFLGNKPVDGTVFSSNREMPPLNEEYKKRVAQYYTPERLRIERGTQSYFSNPYPALHKSFREEPTLFYEPDSIHITNKIFKGNIIICSSRGISIGTGTHLEGVIIVAPRVTIGKGFRGTLQIFANESVTIDEHGILDYPSAICVYSSSKQKNIELKSNSYIQGIVFLGGNKDSDSDASYVRIYENATVEGQLWIEGKMEHKGNIAGSLMCRRFYLTTPTTYYENYLFNADINILKRSPYFLSSALVSSSLSKSIVEWKE
jgi:hypothetical protein